MSAGMLGPYATFIVWSYAVTTVVVLALIGWVAGDYRRQQASLRDLESKGVTRRSGSSGMFSSEADSREKDTAKQKSLQ